MNDVFSYPNRAKIRRENPCRSLHAFACSKSFNTFEICGMRAASRVALAKPLSKSLVDIGVARVSSPGFKV